MSDLLPPPKPGGALPALRRERTAPGKRIGFWLGLAGFFGVLLFGELDPGNPVATRMAAVALLMAAWWISEAVPLAATALIPVVAFPLLGIASGRETAPVYFNDVIFLFLGGFLIALAMERWNLHRRIALAIISFVGVKPSRLVLGFMLATAMLSMWISNTATAIMMLAIALSVIREAENAFGKAGVGNLPAALLIGIAYSASIGGLATLVGTPPNLALVRIFELSFPDAEAAGYGLSFGRWMLFGLPLSAVLLLCAWLVITRVAFRCPDSLSLSRDALRREREALGPMRREEALVAAVFATTAVLWVFRADLALGAFTLPGWSRLLPYGSLLDDGTVAIAMALSLFLIPARRRETDEPESSLQAPEEGRPHPPRRLLDSSVFAKVPWHIILLFGGGFALAKGFQTSGLSAQLGESFAGLEDAPLWLMVAAVVGGITFLTELTSNIATTQMILPVLASVASAANLHPLALMVPAAVAASCAFMMPVATPPNAIVFASGRLRIAQMVKAGLILNFVSIVVITILFLLLGPAVFEMEPRTLPDWAAAPGDPPPETPRGSQ